MDANYWMHVQYLKLNTYVPPHPHNDKSLWGSDYNYAMKIGTDSNAISFNDLRKKEMDSSLKHYISKGFELKYVDQLKYKKIFLKTFLSSLFYFFCSVLSIILYFFLFVTY